MTTAEIGVVGGSGLSGLVAHDAVEHVELDTPFGRPSGPYHVGEIAGWRVAFLARHGDGHSLSPSEINYRANVWGLKALGVKQVISCSAVGSLREELAPRHFVVVDQFIDRTKSSRACTFFEGGIVAHVGLAEPTCPRLRPLVARAARAVGLEVHERGTYVCMEGPQFSTRAESELYRSWNADVVGMTNLTEAKLAREAELCYATLAMVTDYDCWRADEEPVTVDMLLGHLSANAKAAGRLVESLLAELQPGRGCGCESALASALITRCEGADPAARERLSLLLDRYWAP